MVNSKIAHELAVSSLNTFWLKCNRLGAKSVKLLFSITVEKFVQVAWKEKPLHIRTCYNSIKELKFEVGRLFTITKTFREASSASTYLTDIPLYKKICLTFSIASSDTIDIR